MSPLDFCVFILYLIGVLCIGWFSARHAGKDDEYFKVIGRTLGITKQTGDAVVRFQIYPTNEITNFEFYKEKADDTAADDSFASDEEATEETSELAKKTRQELADLDDLDI